MPKESSFVIKPTVAVLAKSPRVASICDFISKYSIYALVFLLPIFFLPWTANVLDFNKQALLAVLIFISLFFWMFKVLISGNFSIVMNKINIAFAVLFFVFLAATLFSLQRYNSFWGWPGLTSESFFSLICLTALYFLVSNNFSSENIFKAATLLVASGFLAVLFGILQLFGLSLIPLDFTKVASFNTIGSLSNLGLFAIVLLPLLLVCLLNTTSLRLVEPEAPRKLWRIISGTAIFLIAVLLVLINYPIIWGLAAVCSVLFIVLGMMRGDLFDGRWLALPMFFLALSLFFLFFKLQINGLPLKPIEVFLTQKTSANIVLQTLLERPVLGSGPGTFGYDFSKYKKIDFNQGQFWNVRFDTAGSKILTLAATTGPLGVLSFLALIITAIFYGAKFLFTKKLSRLLNQEKSLWFLVLGIFSGLVVLSISYFFTNVSLSLEFLYFFLLAALVALISQDRKEYTLESSSLPTLVTTLSLTLIFIFGLGLSILNCQRYIAQTNYVAGLKNWAAGNKDVAMTQLEKAAMMNSTVDFYYRELSQIYLLKLNDDAVRTDLSQEEKTRKVQLLTNNTINAATIATNLNPNSVDNWLVRGSIYQNLIGVVGGADEWAIKSYDEAIKLEPINPYYPVQKGMVYMRKALALAEDEKDEKEQVLSQAKEQFEKALEMKSDYATAHFQLAMVYQAQGRTDEAIASLEEAKKSAPFDVGLAFQTGLLYYQNKDYGKAQQEFERAVGLNPNYSNALYFLGLTYDQQGKKELAIEKIEKVAELNPDNTDIKKVLENLKAGRNALEGVEQEVPPQAPIEEAPTEGIKK